MTSALPRPPRRDPPSAGPVRAFLRRLRRLGRLGFRRCRREAGSLVLLPASAERVSGNLAFLLAHVPEAERSARCRELRAVALVYLGPRYPATVALAEAVADPGAGPRALALLDAGPALPRRRLLSAYGALMAPSGG